MKHIVMLCACVVLAGCGTTKPLVIDKSLRQPPLELLRSCEKATPLTSDTATAIIEKLGEVATLLRECSKEKDALSDWIKQDYPELK